MIARVYQNFKNLRKQCDLSGELTFDKPSLRTIKAIYFSLQLIAYASFIVPCFILN